MIARAWYVMCDSCGNPSQVSVDGTVAARRLARPEGFIRRRVDGRMADLCAACASDRESSRSSKGGA